MTAIHVLLALSLVMTVGLAVAVIDELRWEARLRLPSCTTCGEPHHRHAVHR